MSGIVAGRATARPSQIRMFLRADSPEELVSLQLQANLLLKGRADFTDIQFAQGKWYAWFLLDVDAYPQVIKAINGSIAEKLSRQRAG